MVTNTESYDSSEEAYQFYKNIYNNELTLSKKNYIWKNEISISGDIVFNFNETKSKYFESIIKNDEFASDDKKEYCKQFLKILFEFHDKTVLNISAYPKEGGLNNIKQNLGNDRLDVFISALNFYYQGIDSFILDSGFKKMVYNNRKILKTFLDSFDKKNSTKSLCNIIFFLYQVNDENLINNLIGNGTKHLSSIDSILEYCSLAVRFWRNRAENICKDNDRFYKEEILKKNIADKIKMLDAKLKEINDKYTQSNNLCE